MSEYDDISETRISDERLDWLIKFRDSPDCGLIPNVENCHCDTCDRQLALRELRELRAYRTPGWRLVPVNATKEMYEAGILAFRDPNNRHGAVLDEKCTRPTSPPPHSHDRSE